MSNQFGAFTVFSVLPTEKREAPEQIPEDTTDLELALDGLAPSSPAQYRSALKALDAWRQDRPLTDRTLALYLRHRDDTDRITLSTGRGIVQAAKFRAEALDQPSPAGRLVKAGLKRLGRKAAGRGRGKAKGLRLHEVEKMAGYCERLLSLYGVRDAALFHVMFDGALRCSEAHGLNVEDVREAERGDGVNIHIRRSKTDQAGKGAFAKIGPIAARRLRRWIEHAGIDRGPLFRAVANGRVTERRFSKAGISDAIKKRARECGIEGPVRSHSFRRGCAMELSAAGEPAQEVARAGRWSSLDMVVEYTKEQAAEHSPVARLYEKRSPRLRAVKSR